MTAQSPDRIWIDDGSLLPLRSAPNIFGPRALQVVQFKARATINYRGYTATWHLMKGVLYLISIGGTVADAGWRSLDGTDQCTLADIYGTPDQIPATWVSEDLLIPEPERPWENAFGTSLRVRVRDGVLIGAIELIEIESVSFQERLKSLR